MEDTTRDAEILRLRERCHGFAKDVQALKWRLDEVEKSLNEYMPKVDNLVSDMTIEKAVKSALKSHNRIYLTTAQKLAGLAIALISVADFIRGFHG